MYLPMRKRLCVLTCLYVLWQSKQSVGSVWTCVLIADAKSSEKIKLFSPKISFSGAKILSQE